MTTDPISLTVLQRRFESIAEEMSKVLRRTAYSPNIKERADFSCAIFDNQGRLLAQAEAIPVHLGSMPFVAKPVIDLFTDWKPGDAIVTNSPRKGFGGTHLPDITLLTPIFDDNHKLLFVVANRAHHADVGGMSPGSLPASSTEIFQEGIIIPPVRLFIEGKENSDVMKFILENVRTPYERQGDLRAQYSSLQLGARRLKETIRDNAHWDLSSMQNELLIQSKQGTIDKIRKLTSGKAKFSDYLDTDGYSDHPVKITCEVEITDTGEMVFDFSDSDLEQQGNCNAPLSVTTSACYYVVRLLTGRDVPTNSGCFEPVKIIAPEGIVVNPTPNAATSSSNTETSSRIVDVVLGALSKIIDYIPSASQGTMNNLLIGGVFDGRNWSIYETIGGGTGAGPLKSGCSAIHSHMTNTQNTPIEALELAYPLRVREYSIRKNSGGNGDHVGGDGIIRDIELLSTATITLQTERRKYGPWGQNGEDARGKPGENILINTSEKIDDQGSNIIVEEIESLSSRVNIINAVSGTRIRILTPGGGGYYQGEAQ